MPRPRLTFACELSSERLDDLFADRPVIAGLRALNSRVALPLTAFTPECAGVVHRLNDEGVPVLAIPLLSFDEGYYFTADNFLRAAERYQQWKTWTDEQRLAWDAVGLDTEPDIRLFQQVAGNPWGLVPMLLPRIYRRDRPRRAAVAYAGLEFTPFKFRSLPGRFRCWLQYGCHRLEQAAPVGDVGILPDSDRRRPVDHADDLAPAVRDRDEDVNRVGGCAEGGTDLRHGLDRVQHVDGEAFSEQDHERVPGADRQRVRRRLPRSARHRCRTGARAAQPRPRRTPAEPQMPAYSRQGLMQVFDGLDEVRLTDDDVHVGRLVYGNHFEGHRTRFHELVIPGGKAAAPGRAAMCLSVASGPGQRQQVPQGGTLATTALGRALPTVGVMRNVPWWACSPRPRPRCCWSADGRLPPLCNRHPSTRLPIR